MKPFRVSFFAVSGTNEPIAVAQRGWLMELRRAPITEPAVDKLKFT